MGGRILNDSAFVTIGPEQIREYLRRGDIQVVDLREPEEYALRHLKGAVSIPYDSLFTRAKELDRTRTILFYCTHGSISIKAAKQFADRGYRTVTLIGGINALLHSS